MSLEEFGETYSDEMLEKHGKRLLDQYGVEACECAASIEEASITEDSARTYKPQIRQLVSETDEKSPEPERAVEVVKNSGKKDSTKSTMVSAIKKYYEHIGDYNKAEEFQSLAREGSFNIQMKVDSWITRKEYDRIEEHILPDPGEEKKIYDGPQRSWVFGAEDRALVMTLFYTGCRVGEICPRKSDDVGLSVSDLYPERDQVELYRLKKGGEGYQRDMKVLPHVWWDAIEDYMELKGITQGKLFDFVTRTAQNKVSAIGEAYTATFGAFDHADRLHPHLFRHGRVTDIANNAGVEDAGDYVEHSGYDITDAYRHLAADQQRDILPETSQDEVTIDDLVEQTDGVSTKEELLDKINS